MFPEQFPITVKIIPNFAYILRDLKRAIGKIIDINTLVIGIFSLQWQYNASNFNPSLVATLLQTFQSDASEQGHQAPWNGTVVSRKSYTLKQPKL